MDKELNELNRQLEQKEWEMKLFGCPDTVALKQLFGKKILELRGGKKGLYSTRKIDFCLQLKTSLLILMDKHKNWKTCMQKKLKVLEAQIQDLKKKQENQFQLLKQKQKSDEAAKKLKEEIQCIKAQNVQLHQRIKQEAEQFRRWKASRGKELLQLKKEGRRNECERHKLQALNHRQKMRKTEEAAMATKRLKELLEARKSSARDNSVTSNGHGNGINGQSNEKSIQQWIDHELEVMVNVHEVRYQYEKQSQVRAALAEKWAVLRQVKEFVSNGVIPPRGKNGFSRVSSMPPNARMSRIASLEGMLNISSNSIVAMASALSEAEERERSTTTRGRWNQLRSMGEAKNLLQYMFTYLGEARCQLWEKDIEIKEMKEQLKKLVGLSRQRSEEEVEIELKQTVAMALRMPMPPSCQHRNNLNILQELSMAPLENRQRHGSNTRDGSDWSVVNEEISTCWTWWKTVEMEEESSSVVITVQMEVAKTLETFRID